MDFNITYQLYNTLTGDPDGVNRAYQCKDAADYGRCVKLYKEGYVYLTSINGRNVTETSHNHYPSRYK